jgi:hypothetical protein
LEVVAAADVILEMRDRRALARNDVLNQVADRNDANNFVSLENRQMTKAFVGHDAQAFFYAFVRMRHRQVGRHDLGDFCLGRSFAAQHHFAGVISLR